MLNKLSIRTRLTIFTAIILLISSIILTSISVKNVDTIIPATTVESSQVGIEENVAEFVTPASEITEQGMENIRVFKKKSIIYSIIIISMGSFFMWIVVGKGLEPLNKLILEMENIDENNLKTNLKTTESKDEISKITNSFNNLIAKINSNIELHKKFSSNVSHELYTPLTSIISNIEVTELSQNTTVAEYKETLEIVKEQALDMNKIIYDMKNLNQIIDVADFEIFDIKSLFEKILYDLQKDIERKKIQVEIVGNSTIKGNKSLLERAFTNLIKNAIRYNNQNGKIKIKINSNQISISDTGIGIDQENLPYIFEPFYCENKSRNKKESGTGLGLYITKEIIDKHNYDIEICNNKNSNGLNVTVYFN